MNAFYSVGLELYHLDSTTPTIFSWELSLHPNFPYPWAFHAETSLWYFVRLFQVVDCTSACTTDSPRLTQMGKIMVNFFFLPLNAWVLVSFVILTNTKKKHGVLSQDFRHSSLLNCFIFFYILLIPGKTWYS